MDRQECGSVVSLALNTATDILIIGLIIKKDSVIPMFHWLSEIFEFFFSLEGNPTDEMYPTTVAWAQFYSM